MWIIYVVITLLTYSVSYGIYKEYVGYGFIAVIILLMVGYGVYLIYTISYYGGIMDEIKPEFKKEYIEHKKNMFSRYSLNKLTICLTFLFFVLSRRISDFSEFIQEAGFEKNNIFISIIALLIGITVLLTFVFKYNSLARSEKRELEYMDKMTADHYNEKISKYLEQRRNNPALSDITYLGGYHLLKDGDILAEFKIDGDNLFLYSSYTQKELFNIHISDILDVRYECIEDGSYYSRSIFDTYVINLMYIDYLSESKEKNTIRLKIDGKIKTVFEDRIDELRSKFSEPVAFEALEPIAHETVEDRLKRLKELWEKDLITEEEYSDRKAEILEEI